MSKRTTGAIGAALAVFLAWTAATWLLEGRAHVMLRPEAVAERLVFVVVANLVIGIGIAAVVLRALLASGGTTREESGVGARSPSVLWIAIALVLGLGLTIVQGAPSLEPMVIANAYAQVFAVSAAEVMVCWALVGGVFKRALGGTAMAAAGAAVVASGLFGLYHFGHSPPFDTWPMVGFLALVGLVTSAFFFLSRDIYATMAFHNFLGVLGVLQALAAADRLDGFRTLQVPLVGTALATVLLLACADAFVVRRGTPWPG